MFPLSAVRIAGIGGHDVRNVATDEAGGGRAPELREERLSGQ